MDGTIGSVVIGGTMGIVAVVMLRHGDRSGWSRRRTWATLLLVAVGAGLVVGIVVAALG